MECRNLQEQGRQKSQAKNENHSNFNAVYFCTYISKHGLRMPNEAFFHWNPKVLGLGRQIGQINFGAFGIFLIKLSASILVQWFPCPYFPLFNHYFYKKLSLDIHIPNINLGLVFEFGPQRIRDLVKIKSSN